MQDNTHPLRPRNRKLLLLVGLVLSLLVCTAVSSVAWLTVHDQTENPFTVGAARAEIQESFPDPYAVKSDVSVKNTGDIPVYIRATVSIYWQLSDGSVSAQVPVENQDYTLEWGSSPNWTKRGDLYYYTLPVKVNQSTDILIEQCTPLSTSEDGKTLVVDVLAQVIQASPADAVQDAWGATVDPNGQLVFGTP